MDIRFKFRSKEARRHVAERMRDSWGESEGRSYARLSLDRWHYASGGLAETVADAINGGPAGGVWEDDVGS